MLENLDGDTLRLRSGHASHDFLTKLNQLRKEDLFLDVDLVLINDEFVETKDSCHDDTNGQKVSPEITIKAHKLVLICCSPYFERMFSEKFSEKNQQMVYIGGNLDHSAFEQIINFFYTGLLEIKLSNAIELLQVADLLLLEQTKTSLLRYMQQTLNSDNCILYKDVGLTFCCKALMETADRFARRNFEDVCKSDAFLSLSFEDITYFLQNENNVEGSETKTEKEDALFIKSEDTLLLALLRWVEHYSKNNILSDDERHILIESLMKFINWKEISEKLVNEFSDSYPKLTHSIIPESLEQKFKNRSRRCTKSQWIVLVGFDSRVIEYLDTSNLTRGWSRLTEIPGPGMRYGMSGAGLATHNPSGQIFVVGGVGKGAILQAVSTVLAYDIKSNSWSRISSMNKPRKCHGCTVCHNRLFAVGGIDSRLTISTTEYLDLEKCISKYPIPSNNKKQGGNKSSNVSIEDEAIPSEWREILATEDSQTMFHGGGSSVVAIDTTLYAISIYGSTENDKVCDTLDQDLRWLSIPFEGDGRMPRDRPGIGQYNGNLVVAGGSMERNLLATVEKYDTQDRTWSRMPDLNVPREGPAVITVENQLWIIGGKMGPGNENYQGSVEIFDSESNEWVLSDKSSGLYSTVNANQECQAVKVERILN